MSGPIVRTLSAIASVGATEAFQEKPLQGVTDEDRPTAGSGGLARTFGVGGSAIGYGISEGAGEENLAQSIGGSSREVNPSRGRAMVEAEQASLTRASQVLADKTFYDSDPERRRRERESGATLNTGKRRASRSLTALGNA